MGDSLSLGRIAGIRIGVNWTVLLLAALLVWTLATAVFPDALPDSPAAVHLVLAVVAAVLFLLSILLHELGHALRARRDGLAIEGITLWLLGGVARFRGGFPSAGAELRIALAGPAVSLLLAVLFIGLALVPGMPGEVVAVAEYIGYINALLLVFNMLPALPLDGGRVLRAAIWARGVNFAKATRIAARSGRIIAAGLIGFGLAALLVWESFSGVWLALVGWFLLGAAGAEARASLAQAALAGVRVRDLMSLRPVYADADVTLARVLDALVWYPRHTAYPVLRDGLPIGMIPLSRISEVPRELWTERHVADLMTPLSRVAVVSTEDDALAAADTMAATELQRALVMEDGLLVGILSPSDVHRAMRQGAGAGEGPGVSQPSRR